MDLSPSALLAAVGPWVLAAAAVTLALVAAVFAALLAVPYFLLRFRRNQEETSSASGSSGASEVAEALGTSAPGGLGGFTWTSAQDEDRRAG